MKKIKKELAKIVMKSFPSHPKFSLNQKLSEVINHNDFKKLSQAEKDKILYYLAENHYNEDRNKPFDTYFKKYNLKNVFKNQSLLDLGCWCGGKSVSFAERWNVKEMVGTDVDENFIRAAKLFSQKSKIQNIEFSFLVAYGESLPFKENRFDGIVNYDVFEHVQSIQETLSECYRVLKPGGKMFCVFPSYYTIGEHHLDFATKMPIIHWLFKPEIINKAYSEIIESRGEEAYWYKPQNSIENDWKKYNAGIGINGTTFRMFKIHVQNTGFSNLELIPTPLMSVGKLAAKYKIIRVLSGIFTPLVKINFLQDFLSHRIVAVITK
jgi:ubiquinone/menaquinone biosynthesis C-methylase UbiE